MKIKEIFERELTQNVNTHLMLSSLLPEIDRAVKIIHKKIKLGGKLLFCGNGGSAADAQHLAAEYLVRLRPEVNRRPLPALSLAQDISTLTACGNDYDFSDIFLRPFQALANKNDVLIGITTSGNSLNVLKVLKYARSKKISTLGFLGGSGGKCKNFCDIKLMVPSNTTARVQECHIFLAHFILQRAEDLLIK
jgi:D-sedoheptulose 7-phosphate isomerase|tara:strand:+ start:339 stop:917 length:579 start_codon:yes stop_codon:yes gene_type:complete